MLEIEFSLSFLNFQMKSSIKSGFNVGFQSALFHKKEASF
jgi:hypothetical protein